MSTDKSYVLVDGEQLLSYSLRQRPTISPSFFTQVKLKSRPLLAAINKLSTNPNISIIIVTTCPFTQLIEDSLKQQLPEASFSVFYAQPLRHTKKAIIQKTVDQSENFKKTEANMSPPPGYTLLINHKEFSTEAALQHYTTLFLQRLLQTDRFYDTRELEQKELERQELEQSAPIITPLQKKQRIYLEAIPCSSNFFQPSPERTGSPLQHKLTPERGGSGSPLQHKLTPERTRSPLRNIINGEVTYMPSRLKP